MTSAPEVADFHRRNLLSIQALRGVAAISVVAFHSHLILAQPEYGSRDVFGWISQKGWLGVNFFFVLSGFIIVYAHSSDVGRVSRVPHYVWRRITRVYPIYWVLLTTYVAAAAAGLGHPDFKWEAANFFTAYSLIQVVDSPTLPLKVAWTLLFEVKFYALFVLFLVSKRAGLVVFAVWGVAILVRNCFEPLPDWGYLLPDWGLLTIWNIYFLIGAAVAYLLDKVHERRGGLLALIGGCLLAYLAFDIVDMDSNVRRTFLMVALGIAFGAIILGVALMERSHDLSLPAWVVLLGDASYAIYLVHCAAISLVAILSRRIGSSWLPDEAAYAIVFCAGILAGVIIHLLLERPMLRWARATRTASAAAPSPV